jgi:tetratricopeptide (TPR) repeat protein
MFRRLLAIGLFAFSLGSSVAAPTSDDYYKTGLKLFTDQRLSESETYFRAAVQLDPKNWQAYLGLGHTAMKAGKKDLAIAAYEHSLYYNPDQPAIRTFLDGLKRGGSLNYVWDPSVDPYPLQTGPANPLPKTSPTNYMHYFLRCGIRESFLPFAVSNRSEDKGLSSYHSYSYKSKDDYITGYSSEIFCQCHVMLGPNISLAVGYENWALATRRENNFIIKPISLGIFSNYHSSKIQASAGLNLLSGKISGSGVDYLRNLAAHYKNDQYNTTTLSVGSIFAADVEGNFTYSLASFLGIFFEGGLRFGPKANIDLKRICTYPTNSYESLDRTSIWPLALHLGAGLQIGF